MRCMTSDVHWLARGIVVTMMCKRPVLAHRTPFYKTENSAHVGDAFMSLIHTCQLCVANPFDYLTQLQQHSEELSRNPDQWMPWDYRDHLGTASPGSV